MLRKLLGMNKNVAAQFYAARPRNYKRLPDKAISREKHQLAAGWGRADTRGHSGHVYYDEETPLTFESHTHSWRHCECLPLSTTRLHKLRAQQLREHNLGSPHNEQLQHDTWPETRGSQWP